MQTSVIPNSTYKQNVLKNACGWYLQKLIVPHMTELLHKVQESLGSIPVTASFSPFSPSSQNKQPVFIFQFRQGEHRTV